MPRLTVQVYLSRTCLSLLQSIYLKVSFIIISSLNSTILLILPLFYLVIFMSLCLKLNSNLSEIYIFILFFKVPILISPQILEGTTTHIYFFSINQVLKLLPAPAHPLKILGSPRTI